MSLRHRGPDDDGHFEDASRVARVPPPQHHRPRARQPADVDGRRPAADRLQRRGLQLSRAARASWRRSGTRSRPPATPRWCSTRTRSGAPTASAASTACGGSRSSTSAHPHPRLVLARDHFGIKPLFYARHHGRVVFASEIKAILQDETFPREVDEQQMYEYLRFGLFDHNDGTFFRGIRQVPAAAFAVIEGGAISETVYWTPRLSEDGDASPEAFRAVFERAVQRRLVADVPVGICLSGGLDSSSICTVMAQQLHDHVRDTESLGDRLKTFSAVFPGDRIDESALHRERARRDRRRQQHGAAHRPGLHPRARGVGLAHGGADGVVGAVRHVDGDAPRATAGHGHARRAGRRRAAGRLRPLSVRAAPPAPARAPLRGVRA